MANIVQMVAFRRKRVIRLFERSKAFSADSARTLEELGIYYPDAAFELLYDNVISATGDGQYFLNRG